MHKKLLLPGIITLALIIILLVILPRVKPVHREVTLAVPVDMDMSKACKLLAENGVSNPPASRMTGAIIGLLLGDVQRGIYTLLPTDTSFKLWLRLYRGKRDVFIIQPGMTCDQVVHKMKNVIGIPDDDLSSFLSSRDNMLEGYLAPGRYPLHSRDPEELLFSILDHTADLHGKHGVTRDNLIIASIVQKEGNPSNFDKVASVLHNRLSRGLALSSLAAARYCAGSFRSVDELKRDPSPCTTFNSPGLPPRPICSPGEKALRAASAGSRYHYVEFYRNQDGSLSFK